MKIFVSLVCLACLAISMPQEASAEGDDHIRLRVGVSTISGLLGVEYQKSNIAVDLGWFTPTEEVEVGTMKADALTRIAVGARYFMKPDANGLFGGLSFMTNDQAIATFDGTSIETEGFNSLYATVGYRFIFGERFDFTVGSGYGLALGLSDEAEALGADTGSVSIDLSLGINIK